MRNELGTSVLDPDVEKRLIAQGCRFACRVFHPDGDYHLRTCNGDMKKVAAKFLVDNYIAAKQLNSTSNLAQSQIY